MLWEKEFGGFERKRGERGENWSKIGEVSFRHKK